MNALILNGGGRERPYGDVAVRVSSLLDKGGLAVTDFDLTGLDIGPCRGCFHCWVKTPGLCFQKDAMAEILPRLAKAEVIVWLTPIAYGGYGYELKKALDRSIPILLPFFIKRRGEVHHPLRYALRRRLAVVGILPAVDAESESIFHGLVERNSINMQAAPLSVVLHEGEFESPWEKRLEPLFAAEEN